MCGVLGYICRVDDEDAVHKSADLIQRGLDNLRFRGPDGSGATTTAVSRYLVCLGHTRLSVVDVSKLGAQPMAHGDFEITYNGEIYNFIELRAELQELGYVFESASDTEVIITAWSAWGPDCVKRFNGMFAFALFDKRTHRLWLVRDRFGVKPLFYGVGKSGDLLFSSSAAFIGEFLQAKIDRRYCSRGIRYKVFETDASESPFEDVVAVTPGSAVEVELTSGAIRISEKRWYDLAAAVERKRTELASKALSSIKEECFSLFADAVKIRLRSDVPLAISLSGGLDSSSIAAVAVENIDDPSGFSFGHPSERLTEGPIVERFAEEKAIKTNFIWPEFDKLELRQMMQRVFAAQEAPFGGLSVLAQHEVYRAVANGGYKVLLGGQGGDEVFAGYRKFSILALREALMERDVGKSTSFLFSLLRMLFAELTAMSTYATALKRYTSPDYKNTLLNLEYTKINLWGHAEGSLSSRQLEDIEKFSLPTLLRFEDRNSMANGVESRLPFMDYRLVEFGLALSANQKIKHGYGKWIVRQIMKERVPDFIRLERKKRGFDVTSNWINDGVGEYLRDIILSNREKISEYLIPRVDLEDNLSNKVLDTNRLILDEALMLAWLADPYQRN